MRKNVSQIFGKSLVKIRSVKSKDKQVESAKIRIKKISERMTKKPKLKNVLFSLAQKVKHQVENRRVVKTKSKKRTIKTKVKSRTVRAKSKTLGGKRRTVKAKSKKRISNKKQR